MPAPSSFAESTRRIVTPKIDKPFTKPGRGGIYTHRDEPKFTHKPSGAGADAGAFQKWMDRWDKKTQDKKESQRDPKIVAEEKRQGLKSLSKLHTEKPKGQWDETKAGLEEGVTRVGQMAAGVGSMAGVPGSETRRKMYKDRADTLQKYRTKGRGENDGMSPGDAASKLTEEAAGWLNPTNKPGKVAKVVNTVWHAARGYAKDKSLKDAARASLSHIAGEKFEDVVTRGKGLVGNTAGAVVEDATE